MTLSSRTMRLECRPQQDRQSSPSCDAPKKNIAPGTFSRTYAKSSAPMIGVSSVIQLSAPNISSTTALPNCTARSSQTVTGKPCSIWTSALHPWAAAMPGARRCSSSATRARVCGDNVRIVPNRCAVSGMMLLVVPAAILAMVMTAGLNTEILRVTIV